MPKNEDCTISDSSLCRWINKDCNDCYIKSLKKDEQAGQALEDFEVTLSLLPPDYDDLQGDDCQFCIGEKGKRSVYANIDFAHSEPKSETGMFFGLGKKIRRRVGSYMLTSISMCRRCRMSYFIAEMLKWVLPVVFFGIAAAVLAIPSIGGSINNDLVSFCVLAAAVLAGYVIGSVFSKAYVKAKKNEVRFEVFDIPICAELRDRGWFLLQNNQRLIFSKKPQAGRIMELKKAETAEDEAVQTTLF
jgi:hypothetical protein